MTAKKPNLRQAQKQLTLTLICQAAREMIYSQPYDSITMEQIASAAGVSRATVYLHFANKNELLLKILSENMEEQMELYVELAEIESPNLDSIRAWLQRYRELMDKHHSVRHLFSILFMQLPDRKDFVSNHRERVIEILGERFPGFSLKGLKGKSRERKRIKCYLMLFELEHAVINFSIVPGMPDIDIALDLLAEELLQLYQGDN
ncbi:TetR/AcrR family transcriptional regulator [Halioxenophilus sp. WMMB6]|uniref:TetR/AcrR family transcriptional regulator n=1 Tax=Halioxenophilus sp. WMMB6 TaxID=3073815 RepID=UPI00295F3521|nr:TetR/AcrR family transcriptional regulator [Halioxenophilus sp. WMMB6]